MFNLSLKYRIAGIIFLLEAIMTAMVLGVTVSYSVNSSRTQLEINEELLVDLVGDLSRIALLTSEYDELQPYIEQIVDDPHVESVLLTNSKNRVVVSSNVTLVGRPIPELKDTEFNIWKTKPIKNVNDELGFLGINFSHKAINIAKREAYTLGFQIALTGMVIIAIIGIIIGHLLTRKLDKLSQTAKKVAQGDWQAKTNLSGSDEISILGQTFDTMVNTVGTNVNKLNVSREELLKAHSELEIRVKERTEELAVARDEAIKANMSKSHFLANMSHEIRTPLASVIGFAETSLDDEQSMAERSASLKTIIRNSKHLLHIINDILDLSKVEADKIEVEHIPISPVILLAELAALTEHEVQKKKLIFGINYVFPIPSHINSDPIRLKQILLNLLSNAIKFTEHGHVHLNVRFDQQKNILCFDVVDSGIGMTKEQLEKVFDPFTQADVSTTREYGGTGLGLSLSRQLTEKLGGSIEVVSEIDKGTRFSASFEVGDISDFKLLYSMKEIAQIEHNENEAVGKTPGANALSGLVLLAEDNSDLQRLIARILNKFGLKVCVVDNGKMALEKSRAQSFDLICMDIEMPVMGGIEAIRTLRKLGCSTPIIALTANTMLEDKARFLEIGCNEVAEKPINRDDLYRKLTKFLPLNNGDRKSDKILLSTLISDEPEYADIVLAFVKNLPQTVENIHTHFENKQYEEFSSLVHQLKGTGASTGFPQLTNLMVNIERQLSDNDYQEIGKILLALDELSAQISKGESEYLNILAANNIPELEEDISF